MTGSQWSKLVPVVLLVAAAWAGDGKRPVLSLPELAWSLEIDAPGFVIEEREISPRGDAARLQAKNEATGVILSAFLERAAGAGGAKECREYYWNRAQQSPFRKEQIQFYELGPAAVVEYLVPEHRGIKVNQRNLNAYLAEDGFWIDVHLSTTRAAGGTNNPLRAIVPHIRINRAFTPDVFDRLAFGNMYYWQKNYQKAIAQYEPALELERQARRLPRELWIVLVDQQSDREPVLQGMPARPRVSDRS